MLGFRLLVLVAAATCSACAADIGRDEPPRMTASWQGDVAHFSWTWDDEVDAFNVIVSRDGMREDQIELPSDRRDFGVTRRSETVVTLAIQACVKGILESTCTAWISAEARPGS